MVHRRRRTLRLALQGKLEPPARQAPGREVLALAARQPEAPDRAALAREETEARVVPPAWQGNLALRARPGREGTRAPQGTPGRGAKRVKPELEESPAPLVTVAEAPLGPEMQGKAAPGREENPDLPDKPGTVVPARPGTQGPGGATRGGRPGAARRVNQEAPDRGARVMLAPTPVGPAAHRGAAAPVERMRAARMRAAPTQAAQEGRMPVGQARAAPTSAEPMPVGTQARVVMRVRLVTQAPVEALH